MLVRWVSPLAAPPDPSLLSEIRARPISYPLGSGEAEEVALLGGIKPMIRQRLPAPQARARSVHYRRRGLFTEEIPLPPREGREPSCLLLVAWSQDRLQEAAACEREILGRRTTIEINRDLGRLLGYPRCCTDAFVSLDEPDQDEALSATAARTRGAGSALLNALDLHVFHFIPWCPCTFTCAYSLRYASRLEDLVRPHFSRFLRLIRGALSGARIYLHDEVQLSLEGEAQGGAFWPTRVAPTARDRHPAAALSPEAEADAARALHDARSAQRIEQAGGVLLLDGVPWAPGFLARFS
ncbi:MAG: hypothetical protein IT372_16420 [Polyangiaceae bacterium]|nr:hypothetical protein [Polyangiaceae bacterium]